MRDSVNRAALTDAVARFQAEVRRLALALARDVVGQQIDLRPVARQPMRQAAGQPGRKRARPSTRPPRGARQPEHTASRQLELALPSAAGPMDSAVALPTHAATGQPAVPHAAGGKRVQWTRERIIEELATLMLSGTMIDAPFVTRHGPPGLVAAARRIFGRFDAAMNVAALHVSKLYPEGPPKRPQW